MPKIINLANPTIKEAIRIKEKHNKYRHKAFLIEGPHLVELALTSADIVIKRVFFTESFASKKDGEKLLRQIIKNGLQLIEVSRQILSRLTDTESPQGIAAIVSYKQVDLQEITFRDIPMLVVCDGIQDPGNLGAIIRVSDAAGADAVILLPETCNVFIQKTIRATAGSLLNIPIVRSKPEALLQYLNSRNISLHVTDVHAQISIYESNLKQPAAIAFGSETQGVSKDLLKRADNLLRIPIIGKAESLNVATAVSVCLYEVVRQREWEKQDISKLA